MPGQCKPILPEAVAGAERLGYRVARSSPEGLLLHNPGAMGAPLVYSLDPPSVLVGWGRDRIYRVIRSPRSSTPHEFDACILTPDMDKATGTGRVENDTLKLIQGNAPPWGTIVPTSQANWAKNIIEKLDTLSPRIAILVRWHTGPTPCKAAKLLAGYTPLTEHLPPPGCNWPKPQGKPQAALGL